MHKLLNKLKPRFFDKKQAPAKPNETWKEFVESGHHPFTRPMNLIGRNSKIFCMGSCFALEVRDFLRASGYTVHPKDGDFTVEESPDRVFRSSGRELVYYNTFTMRQEFEKAFGLWTQAEDDFCLVGKHETRPGQANYEDPYRRKVRAWTKEGMAKITSGFDEILKRGIFESDLYIFTLGLTEVWQKKDSGRVVCAGYGERVREASFRQSTFEENAENMRRIAEWIFSRFPGRHIVLSVSPIPLARTFSSEDIFIANTESKSILRAVAAQLDREFENVHYFPAFELCNAFEKYGSFQVYDEGERDVTPECVRRIMKVFMKTYA